MESSTDPQTQLTYQEISHLNERKLEIKRGHTAYINEHPEIKSLLNDFMSSILLNKPQNIFTFARDHFAELVPSAVSGSSGSSGGYAPLVIAGPSGVGKGTLINLLMKQYPDAFGFSVSHTSREARPGEENGVAYHFVSRDEMVQGAEDGRFVEYADVHGNMYGTSFTSVQTVRKEKKICILDIDIQGVESVKNSKLMPMYLFIAPPSIETLEDRLRERNTESEEDIQKRLSNAQREIDYGTELGNFNYVLTNEVLEDAFKDLQRVILEWYPHLGGDGNGEAKESGEGKEGEDKGEKNADDGTENNTDTEENKVDAGEETPATREGDDVAEAK